MPAQYVCECARLPAALKKYCSMEILESSPLPLDLSYFTTCLCVLPPSPASPLYHDKHAPYRNEHPLFRVSVVSAAHQACNAPTVRDCPPGVWGREWVGCHGHASCSGNGGLLEHGPTAVGRVSCLQQPVPSHLPSMQCCVLFRVQKQADCSSSNIPSSISPALNVKTVC